MKKFLSENCRLILVTSFLVIFLPAFCMAVYNVYREYTMEKEYLRGETMFFAQIFSADKKNKIDQTRKLLNTLVAVELHKRDSEICQRVVTAISNQNQQFTYIGIADKNGNLVCGSLPLSEALNIKYRPYFQKMLEKKKFIVGDHSIGSLTGKAVVPFAQPIFDSSDQVMGAVVAFSDINWIDEENDGIIFPPGSVVTMSDSQGIVTECFPKNEECIGKNIGATPLGKFMSEKNGSGSVQAEGVDGARKFYSFVPFFSAPGGEKFTIAVGDDNNVSYGKLVSILAPNVILLLGAAVLAWCVAKKESAICNLQQENKDDLIE